MTDAVAFWKAVAIVIGLLILLFAASAFYDSHHKDVQPDQSFCTDSFGQPCPERGAP